MSKKIIVKMPPFGKARPRVTSHGTYMPKAYEEKRELFRALYMEQGGELNPEGTINLDLIFCFRMPKSWSQKKRTEMHYRWCPKTPDIDNLIGAVMDAIMKQDQYVVQVDAVKLWAKEDRIEIIMEKL